MRVIVTRPRAQAEAFVAALARVGIDAAALPLINIQPVADPSPLQQAWRELPGLALAMFVSANAVRHFFRQRPAHFVWPSSVIAASTGPGTSAALRAAGVPAAALVEPTGEVFDSEALWLQLRERDWAGRRALIVHGGGGRDWLAEHLRGAGGTVDFVSAYSRHRPELDASTQALLAHVLSDPAGWLWLLSSSEAVANLDALAPGADWSRSLAMAAHPRIATKARELGFGHVDLGELGVAAVARRLASARERSIQSDAP